MSSHQNLMASRLARGGCGCGFLASGNRSHAAQVVGARHFPCARCELDAARVRCRAWVAEQLRRQGRKTVVIRHPMPYGDLAAQAVQRFATLKDLDLQQCTIEEREE